MQGGMGLVWGINGDANSGGNSAALFSPRWCLAVYAGEHLQRGRWFQKVHMDGSELVSMNASLRQRGPRRDGAQSTWMAC